MRRGVVIQLSSLFVFFSSLLRPKSASAFFQTTYLVKQSRSRHFFGDSSHSTSRSLKTKQQQQLTTALKAKRRRSGDSFEKEKATSLTWRLFNINIPLSVDPGKDHTSVFPVLARAVEKKLGKLATGKGPSPPSSIDVVRKSYDGRVRHPRIEPTFAYVVDVEFGKPVTMSVVAGTAEPTDSRLGDNSNKINRVEVLEKLNHGKRQRPSVIVVGAGPAGLFAALSLTEVGFTPIVVERGQPVNIRGRDIGALINRRKINAESNLCFGEGGAGTWSDGKLTTRIGRNSGAVRHVLKKLVEFGAPDRILVDGKPHLGTDRMVKILRSMREYLIECGVEFKFGTRVEKLLIEGDTETSQRWVKGVELSRANSEATNEVLKADHVVLAIGHSARDLYRALEIAGVPLQPKGFAVGFRVEHPQQLINDIQLKRWANLTADERNRRGYGKVPVADYRLAANIEDTDKDFESETVSRRKRKSDSFVAGRAEDSSQKRAVYSFCMCPGGQIMPTSMDESYVCVNGMSFSKRSSRWANSALVVTVDPSDKAVKDAVHEVVPPNIPLADSPLVGVFFQEAMEKKASIAGGGGLVVPVQRVTDYLEGQDLPAGIPLPESSYKLGTKAARLDLLYPPSITAALRKALRIFDQRMPGFICDEALLHGVETRTSAPVTIPRNDNIERKSNCCDDNSNQASRLECVGIQGLWPAGEGAGHAGGIVSAAVDGLHVGRALASSAGIDMEIAGFVEGAKALTDAFY